MKRAEAASFVRKLAKRTRTPVAERDLDEQLDRAGPSIDLAAMQRLLVELLDNSVLSSSLCDIALPDEDADTPEDKTPEPATPEDTTTSKQTAKAQSAAAEGNLMWERIPRFVTGHQLCAALTQHTGTSWASSFRLPLPPKASLPQRTMPLNQRPRSL